MHYPAKLLSRISLSVLMLAVASLTCDAQTVKTIAAKADRFAPQLSLEKRASDLALLNFASAEAVKQLAAPKNFSLSHRNDSVLVAGPITGKSQNLIITSGSSPWDLSTFLHLVVDVRNEGKQTVTIVCRAEDPEYAGWHHYSESVARVQAGETASVLVFLKRKNPPVDALRALFPGMDALPNGYMGHWSGIDPSRISRVVLGLESPGAEVQLELLRIRATGACDPAPFKKADYFPFIDAYGQFSHAEWPTKIHSPADFAAQRTAETAALHSNPRPISWDKYGGFKNGPQLNATGSFRVEKYANKWWLVDPDGRLFWSHGVTGVGFGSTTPVHGREKFFAELPVTTRGNGKVADWYLSNLKIKFGDYAENEVAALDHERFSSWGLNTMAVWSDARVTSLDRTPYTKILGIGGPKLAPELKLADPYDEAFARSARNAFEAEKESTGKDPWCIGYFIGNELPWHAGADLINEVLTAPAKQPGKIALVKILQHRHPTIADLNTAWHSTYESWDSFLNSTTKVDAKLAASDFTAFNEALAQRYYETCQTELKRATPNRLNLGSRFNTVNPITVRTAAHYCDVVSFNKYETSLRTLKLPDNLDRPIIIGEFHFPAWDRSYTASADCGTLTEARRADSYWYYLTSALDNPLVVGTHWFQFLDQPLTGRGDGENFPVGFVDVTDTPYDQLTKVTRELGDTLYARRLQNTSLATPR